MNRLKGDVNRDFFCLLAQFLGHFLPTLLSNLAGLRDVFSEIFFPLFGCETISVVFDCLHGRP